MKSKLFLALLTLTSSSSLWAASYSVEVQNVTRGVYFAPLLVSAHTADAKLFTLGSQASVNLQSLAESGNITGVSADLAAASANNVMNPAGGLLAPGATTTADLGEPDAGNDYLTVIGMIVPSNDGFIALNTIPLPTEPGTYVYMLNGYDAGTEGNDEIRGSGSPGAPGMGVPAPLDAQVGHNGTGIPNVSAEGFVHVHPGHIGDLDMNGGQSDLNAASHRWLNPMARVTVTVQ